MKKMKHGGKVHKRMQVGGVAAPATSVRRPMARPGTMVRPGVPSGPKIGVRPFDPKPARPSVPSGPKGPMVQPGTMVRPDLPVGMPMPIRRAMRGGGLARKGVGMALAKGGLARRAGGCAKRGFGKGKIV